MDPLTHTLAGLGMARAGLDRTTPRATTALLVGANLPDIDIVSYGVSTDAALGFRRGWTHGVLAVVILPALLFMTLVLVERYRRRRGPPVQRGRLLGLCYLAVLTHPLLDLLNNYGIRLLMPFDHRWFYGDAVFIVDPWLWLVLGGTAFLTVRGGRAGALAGWVTLALICSLAVVSSGRVTPPAAKWAWFAGLGLVALVRSTWRGPGRRWAALGLTLAGLYVATMVATSRLAFERVEQELEQNGIGPVERLMVGPTAANPLRWDVVAQTPEAYRYGSFHWLRRPGLRLDSRKLPRLPSTPLVEAALGARHVRGARRWMRFPFVEVQSSAEGHVVYLLDARYVREPTRGFGAAVVELDGALRVPAR